MSICLQIHSFQENCKPFPVEHGDPVGLYSSLVETSSSLSHRRVLSKGVHIHIGHVYLQLTAIGVRTWWIKKNINCYRCQRATIGNNRFANSNNWCSLETINNLNRNWHLDSQQTNDSLVVVAPSSALCRLIHWARVTAGEMDEGIKVPGTIGKNVDELEFSYPTDVEKTCICIYRWIYL